MRTHRTASLLPLGGRHKSDDYTVPIGVGFGKVIPQGSTVFNVFIEPQVSIFDRGNNWPQWQVFVGFNMQFLGK